MNNSNGNGSSASPSEFAAKTAAPSPPRPSLHFSARCWSRRAAWASGRFWNISRKSNEACDVRRATGQFQFQSLERLFAPIPPLVVDLRQIERLVLHARVELDVLQFRRANRP